MSMNCNDPCAGQTITASNLAPLVYVKGVDINGCHKWESPAAMICRIVAGLPQLGAPPPGVKFLGSDCRLYDPDAAAIPETPLTVVDSPSVDLTASGVAGHTLTAAVNVSAAPGNQVTVLADGIFVDVSALDICGALPGVAAFGVLPPTATVLFLDGAVCGRAPLPAETPFVPVTTPSVQATPGGLFGHSPIYDVRVSALAGNAITTQPDGLFVPTVTETPLTVNDSATVDFTGSGVAGHTVTASVRVSALAGNIISIQPDGVYAAFNLCAALAALPASIPPYVPGVTQLVGANCSLFTIPATAAETPLTVADTPSIDLTSSGTAGHTLTAAIIVSPNAGNALTVLGNGVYVPDFCTQANLVDTTPLFVPPTADVLYVDVAGNCARAPLPAASAVTACSVGAVIPAGAVVPTTLVGLDASGCLVRVGNCSLLASAFWGSAAPVGPNQAELLARTIGSQCPMVVPARFNARDGNGNVGTVSLGLTAPMGQMAFNAPLGSGLAVLLTPNAINGSVDVEYGIDVCNGWDTMIPVGVPVTSVGLDASGCLVKSPPAAGFAGFSIKADALLVDPILSGETAEFLGAPGLDTVISAANQITVSINPCEVPAILATTPIAPNNFATFMVVDAVSACWSKFTVAPTCTSPNVYNAHALVWDDLQGWHFGKVGQRRTTRYLGPADSGFTILPREHNTYVVDNGVAFTLNLPVITNCDQTHFRIRLTADVGGALPLTINAAAGQTIQPPTGPDVTTFVIFNNTGRETWDIEFDGTSRWFFFV